MEFLSSDLIFPGVYVCVCDFFRTVNHMNNLEIPLHILVVKLKTENK